MINVTKKYIEACESNNRTSYIVAKYGLFNKNAKNEITMVVSTNQPFSIPSQTYDELKELEISYISCEPNRVKLNDKFIFIQDKSKTNINQNLGIWSKAMSDVNGLFLTPFEIEYQFSDQIAFTDLTLYFQDIVKDMNIKYYVDNSLIYTREIRNNDKLSFETTNSSSTMATQYFNRLVLSFLSTKEPYRYIKLSEIDFGVYMTFKKEEIEDIEIIDELNIDTTLLSANSCTITIKDNKGEYDIINPYNKLKLLQEKQEINVFHYLKVGDTFKEVPLGTFLVKNLDYKNKKLIIESYDDRYFMNKTYYGSKFYINEPFKNVLKDLFDYFNYTSDRYLIDGELENKTINGYIPIVNFGEALRLICESVGAVITKNRFGITKIIKNFGSAIKIFKNREYEKSSPTKQLYNNVIDIYEYSYKEETENRVLFEGTLSQGNHEIVFDKSPIIYNMYKDDYNLLKSDINNNNYNIVKLYASGCLIEVTSTSADVNLSGKCYMISKTIKRIYKNGVQNTNVDEYAISKVDNALIGSERTEEIANWKLNKNEFKYSFTCNLMPYIEVGDTCKLQIPYKTINGHSISKTFVPTKLVINMGIKQDIEGE